MQLRTHVALVLVTLGCASRPTRPVGPARPPDPVQVTLPEVRVTRNAWRTPTPQQLVFTRRNQGQRLDINLAQPALLSSNDPARACYKAFLAFSPQAAGQVVTLMRVNGEGSVDDVETIGSTDPSLSIMTPCVLNAVRSRRFPATRMPSLVSFPFIFRSGEVGGPNSGPPPVADLPAARPGEVRVPNPEPVVARPWRPALVPNATPTATLSRDQVDQVVPDVQSLMDTCYGAALVMLPDFAGDFTLNLSVEPSGHVNRLGVTSRGTFSAPMQQCIETLGRQLVFHASITGAQVTIPVTLSLAAEEPEGTPASTNVGGAGSGVTISGARPGGLMPISGGH